VPYSKVAICNIALSLLGEDSIRSFTESNKRARSCSNLYDVSRDYILSTHDWAFARKFRLLQQLSVTDTSTIPSGLYVYALPYDCETPRDIYPRGSQDFWTVSENTLLSYLDTVSLYYTSTVTNPALFSNAFINILSIHLAYRLCIPITQDKALAKQLYTQYMSERLDSFESDANIGNDYRSYDEDPNNDAFVAPDGTAT